MHLRAWIRDQITARLAGLPGVSSPVLESLAQVVDEKDVPAVAFSYRAETVDAPISTDDDADEVSRALEFSIAVVALTAADIDTLTGEIERRMQPYVRDGMPHRITGTRFQDPVRGEYDFFSAAVDYRLEYVLSATDPSRLSDGD